MTLLSTKSLSPSPLSPVPSPTREGGANLTTRAPLSAFGEGQGERSFFNQTVAK